MIEIADCKRPTSTKYSLNCNKRKIKNMQIVKASFLLAFCCLYGLFLTQANAQTSTKEDPVFNTKFYEGLEWRNIGPNRGGRSLGCADSPGRPNEYYFGATGGGLWKTVDGGNEWFPVTDGQVTSSSVGAVAVAETNPDIVYIGMGEVQLRGSITQGDGVYKTTDGGKTWRHLRLEETQAVARIRIHPTNPDIVYVAALGHPYGDNPERGVFRSTDGGKTFDITISVPHGDNHDIWIDPNNPDRMINSNDGGGNVTINGGKTWTEQDFCTTQFYHVMATSDVPYHVAGAQQDNSPLAMPSDGWDHMQARGPNHGWWYAVGGGESGWITQPD